VLIVAIGVWVALGLAAAWVMRRRGHDAFSWSILFLFLGPIALPVAVSAERHRPPESDRPMQPGALDVLVAHDGSAAATAALEAALTIVGGDMTSITLAEVVDIEAATTIRGRETTAAAQSRLDAVAAPLASSTTVPVATVVLHGDPAHALAWFAAHHGYELIVVGGSGPGRRWVRRGSVARRLASCSTVPLLVGPNAAVRADVSEREAASAPRA
jgi:nucleotide-binding universal stress UspA family protein